MLSLQKCRQGLSALTNSVFLQLNPIATRRASMLFSVAPLLPMVLAASAPSANCSDPFVSTLVHGLGMIISVLMGLWNCHCRHRYYCWRLDACDSLGK